METLGIDAYMPDSNPARELNLGHPADDVRSHDLSLRRMREKMQSEQGRHVYRKRKSVVELECSSNNAACASSACARSTRSLSSSHSLPQLALSGKPDQNPQPTLNQNSPHKPTRASLSHRLFRPRDMISLRR